MIKKKLIALTVLAAISISSTLVSASEIQPEKSNATISNECYYTDVKEMNTDNLNSNKIDLRSRPADGYTWTMKPNDIKLIGDKTLGNWVHIYTGHPASRQGEYDTISKEIGYSHTFSGSFTASFLKQLAQVSLGYSFGTSESFSIAKNSAPLKEGEYVKAYYIKNYDVSEITQRELYFNSNNRPVYKETGKTQKVTAYKAIFPKLKFEYYNRNGHKVRSLNALDAPSKVEYYEYRNGQYTKVD
ncbi:hypothetical protein [Clostridium sp. ZS2-4]|uniref:hypothetical protein n=1 Tax=Clostridium sp. ZS2-4 TaxID=2987703 RepID=UPI00227B749A|nr:hypothetical protein [Clostridium sp. ZS2-4]MCY6356182.1 hypothetical protein [Clostridium sp. ZS2-4]